MKAMKLLRFGALLLTIVPAVLALAGCGPETDASRPADGRL